ncbi:MAG: hypothetical protein PCFJNLEI_00069 [Verrucomicrobiae bacterium]|nr:hypothetical protein [Verrucomicrobiae bacterium]
MTHSPKNNQQAFTLVELLAVIVIITILIAVAANIVIFSKRRIEINRAQSEIAALELALDSYKADHGRYPESTIYRYTCSHLAERTNSWLLYRALCSGPKKYINLRNDQLAVAGAITYIVDPWRTPYMYYCPYPPQPTLVITSVHNPATGSSNNIAIGGQVNLTSFDLMSFGPDTYTYIPGFKLFRYEPNTNLFLVDDIKNFK